MLFAPRRCAALFLLLILGLTVAAQTSSPVAPQTTGPVAPANPPPVKAQTPAPAEHILPAEPPSAAGPRISYNFVNVDGTYIAMTFDDGPAEKLTPELLDLLAKHRIKATFFVIGQNAAEYPDIVARAAREGHEIANHSWSHPNFGKMSDESVRKQLRQTDDVIKKATGKRPTLMRPPYGSITNRQRQWIHDEFGYQIILWDVDPLDWKRPGAATICNRIVKLTRPGSIVLSHDIHPGTIEAMPDTLNQLEAKGFKFVTVSELIAMAKPDTPAPKTVRSQSTPSSEAARAPKVKPSPVR
ncbi:MAG TPA: polysaccharide deacetylase family protein [Chthoniobacterales bacterium]|nr:polysaccharide deacetylase family protein [Chthoniobacterales bacterium]